jgi:protein tyrosine/serine phosphatase
VLILRWSFGLGIAALVTLVPYCYYRATYAYGKRLREVTPGVLYRSGQMTAEGFTDAVRRYHIRTIINLQDEYPDPDLRLSYFGRGHIKESELCQRLGVRYVYIPPDLISRRLVPQKHPVAIDRFREVMNDPSSRPVLIHCRAGLHRTGVITAVYRMEYENWTPQEAMRELKANGFGEFVAVAANDYIKQYILTYQKRTNHRDTENTEKTKE